MWKKIRLFLCREFGWHSPTNIHFNSLDTRSFLIYAECKVCGFKGLMDSQGNLF